MRAPLRILDRFVLDAVWPAFAVTVAASGLLWLTGGAASALAVGPYALAVGLAVVYARWARNGEFAALLQAGISPRRIAAPVVIAALALALAEAAIACALVRPDVPTQYAGYVLAALQLPLIGSLSLPITMRSRNEEPWAAMSLLLVGYAIAVVVLRVSAGALGWAPGLEWLFVDGALFACDLALFRALFKPRAKL